MEYNFLKIQQDYPLAFEKLKQWVIKNLSSGYYKDNVYADAEGYLQYSYHRSDNTEMQPDVLPHFFDSEGFHISVNFEPYHVPNDFKIAIWYHSDSIEPGVEDIYGLATRELALSAAFTKAFELLNNFLNHQQGSKQ